MYRIPSSLFQIEPGTASVVGNLRSRGDELGNMAKLDKSVNVKYCFEIVYDDKVG